MAARVALVTGANKGIGYGIVKKFCQEQPDWIVYLASRDKGRGEQAKQQLESSVPKPENLRLIQLDIDSQASIDAARNHLRTEHGGLDVLVNNAAIAYKAASTAPFSEQASVTVDTNFTALLRVCDALFPLLRSGARVVNVGSRAACFSIAGCSEAVRQRLLDPALTMDGLKALMAEFVQCAQDDKVEPSGWRKSAYGVSKIGVALATFIQQKAFDKDPDGRTDMVVNVCCPGWVVTDMSSHSGKKTVDEGADTPAYLAQLPAGTEIRGKFVAERNVMTDWVNSPPPL